jgi:hypothetical protein
VTCTGANAAGSDPVQVLVIANPADAAGPTSQETLNLVIGLADGTAAPGRVKVVVETDGQTNPPPLSTFATNSPTIQGHPGAAGAMAIGAAFYFATPACGTTPATLEPYSSVGGDPILFDSSGTRLTTAIQRQKPNVVGPDGVNTTFLGFSLYDAGYTGSDNLFSTPTTSCQNDASYPNFFGTSAATPHVAGIAALMLQANSALTPTQIYDSLQNSALAIGTVPNDNAANYSAGYGFVQAQAAIALLPPGAPTLTSSATSVTAGTAVTLTWQSYNTTACTAGGTWSGSLAVSGTQTVTPNAAGSYSYTLTCANSVGTSSASSVTLTVSAAASNTTSTSSSGGGSASWILLLGVAGFSVARSVRATLKSRGIV